MTAPTVTAWAIKEEREQRLYKIIPRATRMWFDLGAALLYAGYRCVKVQITEASTEAQE